MPVPGPSTPRSRGRRAATRTQAQQRALAASKSRGATEEYCEALEDIEALNPDVRYGLDELERLDAETESGSANFDNNVEMYFREFENESFVRRKCGLNNIKKEMIPTLIAANKKVHVASAIEAYARRSLRALEQRLARAAEHLEATTPGITTVIEDRVLNGAPDSEQENFHNTLHAVVKRRRGRPPKQKKPFAVNYGALLVRKAKRQLTGKARERSTIDVQKKMKQESQKTWAPTITALPTPLAVSQQATKKRWTGTVLHVRKSRKSSSECDNVVTVRQEHQSSPTIPEKYVVPALTEAGQKNQKISGAGRTKTSVNSINAQKRTSRILKNLGVDSGTFNTWAWSGNTALASILSEELKDVKGRITRSRSELRPNDSASQDIALFTAPPIPSTVDNKLRIPPVVQLTRLETENKENAVKSPLHVTDTPVKIDEVNEVKTRPCYYDFRKTKSAYRRPQPETELEEPHMNEDVSSIMNVISDCESTPVPATVSVPPPQVIEDVGLNLSETPQLYEAGIDPQIYCVCGRQAFGQMIACDGENCLYEWFHFQCIGIKMAPLGNWYCANCSQTSAVPGKERRRRRSYLRKSPRPSGGFTHSLCNGCC